MTTLFEQPAPQAAAPPCATLRVGYDPHAKCVRVTAEGRGTKTSRVVYLHLLTDAAQGPAVERAVDQALHAVGCTEADL